MGTLELSESGIIFLLMERYKLTSMEEPTDEQLQSVMSQVGERARESSRKAQAELDRRMDDVRQYARELHGR